MNTKQAQQIAANARLPYVAKIHELEAINAELLAALRHIADNLVPAAGSKSVREEIATVARAAIAKAEGQS